MPPGCPARVKAHHVFSEASLCLEAAIAGQGVMLAWHLLALNALKQRCVVATFDIEAPSGMGHYLVTRSGTAAAPRYQPSPPGFDMNWRRPKPIGGPLTPPPAASKSG